jgi:hypothetical protein
VTAREAGETWSLERDKLQHTPARGESNIPSRACALSADYEIDETRGLVIILPGEQTVAPDIAAAFDRILADPRFGPDYHFLSDRRGVTHAPDRQYVDQAVAVINRYRSAFGDRRWAVLVDDHNLAMYGMGRVAEAFSSMCGVTLRVFTDFDEAVAWLETGTVKPDPSDGPWLG